MTIKKISVIICTKNRSALLPRVIGGLQVQEYPQDGFEIIVVNNGSTDDTRVVIEKLIDRSNVQVKYIEENRPGITFARNRGAEAARYPYLAYLDDDCSVGRDWLSQLLSGFDLQDDFALVAGKIVVDYDDQKIPTWLGPKSERWLAKSDYQGSKPFLLGDATYVPEGNIAIKRKDWEALGGFIGMDLFGVPHEASNESMYYLEQIKRHGGKVVFVPGAKVNHHTVVPTQKQLIKRAFWNGVSAGILEYLLNRQTLVSKVYHEFLNSAAMIAFFALSLFSIIKFNKEETMYQLLRAIRRIGLVLSELHLVGDWHGVRSWVVARK